MPVQPSQFIAEDANQQFKEAKQSRGIFPSENKGGGEEHSVKVTDFLH